MTSIAGIPNSAPALDFLTGLLDAPLPARREMARAGLTVKAPGDALERLIGLGLSSIQDATAKLRAGGSVATWRREMERAIATQHQAAYLAATAQRLKVPLDSPLLSRARLSRAERADIAAAVRGQLQYLDKFAAELAAGRLSPAQAAARANLYGQAIKPFYYQQRYGDWEIPDSLIPGNQQCLGNCKCFISVADNGDGTGTLTRTMGGAEHHCSECPGLVGDHPIKRRGKA